MFATFARGLLTNLRLVLRAVLPLPMPRLRPASGTAQIAISLLIGWSALAGLQFYWLSPVSEVDGWGMQFLLAETFVALAGIALGLLLTGRSSALRRMTPPVLLAFCFGQLGYSLYWFKHPDSEGTSAWAMSMVLLLAPPCLTILRVMGRATVRPGLRAPVVSVIFAALVGGAHYHLPASWLFYQTEDETAYPEEARIDIEALYTAQDRLLSAQIGALAPGDTTKADIYALVAGGTADQTVFASEVSQVTTILTDGFGARGHILALANDEADPFLRPLANKANLARALAALGARMDADRDIAVLYLTSHGGPDVFSLNFWQAGTTDLSSAELAAMLDASGIRNMVVILSACKSGSFIDEIRGPDRLVITAAAADRNSFGCGDNIEWTWFGDALFNHALRDTRDFRTAFVTAKTLVNAWEWRHWRRASKPQISQGANIGAALDAWLTDIGESPTEG